MLSYQSKACAALDTVMLFHSASVLSLMTPQRIPAAAWTTEQRASIVTRKESSCTTSDVTSDSVER